MKTTLLTLALCLGSLIGFSQENLLMCSIDKFDQDHFVDFITFQPKKLILNCTDKCGATDSFGKVIIDYKYASIRYLDLGLYEARDLKNKLIIFNENGQIISEIDSCVNYGRYFIENRLRFGLLNKKFGYIDNQGKIIIDPIYERADDFSEGYARVQLTDIGKCGYIDSLGNVAIPFIYDGSTSISNGYKFSEGLVAVKFNNLWGYINYKGNEIIPFKYIFAGEFKYGLAPVGIKYKGWGFIDNKGAEIIPPNYDHARSFSEGIAVVRIEVGSNKKYGFIDTSGKAITPIKYDWADSFSEGLALVNIGSKAGKYYPSLKKPGEWSYIDTSGKEIIVLKNQNIDFIPESFSNGKAKIYTKERIYYIDKNGNEIKE